MPTLIKKVAELTREPVKRFRILWLILSFAVALTFIEIGGGYAFAGQGATATPIAFRVILLGGHLPGGFRTHGWIMVLLGLVHIWGVASFNQRTIRHLYNVVQWSAYGITGYSVWVAVAFAGGVEISNQYTAVIWLYVFIAIVCGAKTALHPSWE